MKSEDHLRKRLFSCWHEKRLHEPPLLLPHPHVQKLMSKITISTTTPPWPITSRVLVTGGRKLSVYQDSLNNFMSSNVVRRLLEKSSSNMATQCLIPSDWTRTTGYHNGPTICDSTPQPVEVFLDHISSLQVLKYCQLSIPFHSAL